MKRTPLLPILLALCLLLLVSVACSISGSSTPPTATLPPEPTLVLPNPTDTPPVVDTPAPAGIPVSANGIRFTIPTGLASGATVENVAAVSDQNGPGWDVAPAHSVFTLENYVVQGMMHQPKIYVYPAAEYATVSNGAAISLQRLSALKTGAVTELNKETVPFVPFFNAAQSLMAQTTLIKFQNGAGVRMVAQYDQAPIPANNHELFYHFQGLTDDGKYYIIAIFPLNCPILPADDNPNSPVPPGGVAFNQDDPVAYFAAVAQAVNNIAADRFAPSLTALDALTQSIQATTP